MAAADQSVGSAELAGAQVLVAGAGVTGESAARALLGLGAWVTVTGTDPGQLAEVARAVPGVRTAVDLAAPPEGTTLVVTSPGIRPTNPLLVESAARGIEVIGEVELAWRMCAGMADPPAWLAITGTNGKTTTVGMLAEMLTAAGLDAIACGNVGLPVVDAVTAGHRVLAVELSSFQLYWAPSVRPTAGVLLNLAEDHLDWHGTMAAYVEAKARVLTGAVAVAGVDDDLVAGLLTAAPAEVKVGITMGPPKPGRLGLDEGHLVDRAFAEHEVLAAVDEVRPPGPSALFDALAASALARAYGLSAEAVAAGLRAFRPGAHRAVPVAEIDGVVYVDDSKASNPHAAAASIRAHERVVWIAGGLLKGASVDDLVQETRHRLAGAVLLGADREVIGTALRRHAPDVPVYSVSSGDDDPMTVMSQVVRAARELARPGDAVVLAPAGASWDMFTDYGQRGDMFAAAVAALRDGM
ncbi:MAG TPA: UDP-N-acetylmuramoyl-L-alanine--D-glutamate ligase [Pseudonocardiaceae bacterium]|jgi:UDP-N-acetylmuramoylalanine--D-glutamate ligase|nr:UDP-N-acetylmuramoyl-L-alanine--D-glutamate ligase [Pseudonocardiaceae bacterium]